MGTVSDVILLVFQRGDSGTIGTSYVCSSFMVTCHVRIDLADVYLELERAMLLLIFFDGDMPRAN